MKTKKVRPVLVEAIDKNDIYNLLLRPKGNVLKCNTGAEYRRLLFLSWIPQELILISLEDDKIEEGDWYCYLSYKGDYKLNQYNEEKHFNEDPCVTLANLKAKKVIARQSQIPLEYISKFIEQYNNGCVEDFEIKCGGSYEEFLDFCGKLGYDYDRAFGWYKRTDPGGNRPNTSKLEDLFNKYPKLTNGFVTIVENEPILYTEEEVKHLCLCAMSDAQDNIRQYPYEYIDEWFEQNKKK